ncbi:uncharacterized protein LOC132911932 [Bombus pascuorum]|uniref:uncharacterized protein LOC132911932 n=1 Tax=Bombus pascuorum TaxID=65598 RepID=UPI002134F5DF|nr:uncharacterized protein LOC132911932 [Bombus pascuorum]
MNHIAQAWNAKFSNKSNSPTCNRLLSSSNILSSTMVQCGSWRSRMLDKVKECRDAIKNMVAFDKSPNNVKTTQTAGKRLSNSFIHTRATTSLSSIPDVITFSSIALKHKEYEDVPILMRDSILNSDKSEKLNTSVEPIDRTNDANDSFNRFVSMDNMISNSLKSFLALEEQVKEEFLEQHVSSIKKKISAEPFLSYAEGNAEFIWTDDTTEEGFFGNAWNSLEHLDTINIGNPRRNSTFYEDFCLHKNRTSSPIRNHPFQDSGFENNFSI